MHLKEALDILEQIAFYLELKGENVFKINAFYTAIRNLSNYDISLNEAFEKEIIQNTKGVGKSILSILKELNEKNETHVLNELKSEFPEEIYALTQIRGLGAKKIKKLFDELRISNLDELEQACIENKLMKIPGFGEKTQSNIFANIERIKKTKGKLLLHKADLIKDEIINQLNSKGIKIVVPTGSLRLRSKTISQLDFLILKEDFERVSKSFELKRLSDFEYGSSYKEHNVVFHLSDNNEFSYRLVETTGTDDFLNRIKFKTLKEKKFKTEEEVFASLTLPFIPPQARENSNLELKQYDFPDKNSLRGLIHIHSHYSDGSSSLEEIKKESGRLNYEYVLICDHSKSAYYANGLDEKKLKEQWKEIDSINSTNSKTKLLKGIECDILVDGSLDFDDGILSQFDCVIASVHSRFSLSKGEMTNRIIRALKNKHVKILGHPTGRLLLSRDPYQIDMHEIINVAGGEGKSIELNCNPYRLDIDWEFIQYAISKGVLITIAPDAHSITEFNYVKYGLDMAIKGGAEKKDIVNCLTLEEFLIKFCRK